MKHFLLILFGIIYLNANSSNVSGIDCSLNKFYYVIGRDVFCSDIYSKDVKWSRSLDKDTLIRRLGVGQSEKAILFKNLYHLDFPSVEEEVEREQRQKHEQKRQRLHALYDIQHG